ncbi:MAG: hypothetical protein J5824_02930 [Lachnospiraceae bacterium]|nr:hypothetical protein [Lachnospiraceae bacterium]
MGFDKRWLTTKSGTPDFPIVEEEIQAITNPRYLKKIAEKAECYEYRKIAACKIDNQKLLIKMANEDESYDVRVAALRRIADPGIRLAAAKLFIKDTSSSRFADSHHIKAIAAVINDYPQAQAELREIISHGEPDDVINAAKLLDDKETAQKEILRAALEAEYGSTQERAIELLTDDDALLTVSRNAKYGDTALMAAKRIKDPAKQQLAFREIAFEERFSRLNLNSRYEAAELIKDKETQQEAMREIMPIAECSRMQQSGSYVWEDKNMAYIVNGCRRYLGE